MSDDYNEEDVTIVELPDTGWRENVKETKEDSETETKNDN